MTERIQFADRLAAGHRLGEKLAADFEPAPDTLVLGLVRGGAVIAHQLAAAAGLAWDILLVRKLGAPHQPEYAVGAYAESGALLLNEVVLKEMGLDADWIQRSRQRAEAECRQLHVELRGDYPPPRLAGRDLVLCDDGMATGLTMQAAVAAVRQAGANRLIVAVPVLPPEALRMLARLEVERCYLACPDGFHAVGQYYADFAPVATHEVRRLLAQRR